MATVTVKIDKTGSGVKIDVDGVAGEACLNKASKNIMEMLRNEAKTTTEETDEMYQVADEVEELDA